MILGKQTGSVVNYIAANGVRGQPTPEVGMGATLLHWTDRSPATIVKVEKKAGAVTIMVQEDHAVRTDKNGMSESQTYFYTPNPEGALSYFRQSRDGTWAPIKLNPKSNRWIKRESGPYLRIGERERYHDFSF